jgi:hypothetical protein
MDGWSFMDELSLSATQVSRTKLDPRHGDFEQNEQLP